jgi:methyltransferase family protein
VRYVNRHHYILAAATGKTVLDVGVIGETEGTDEQRLAAFPSQLHWQIASVAREAVGTDYAVSPIVSLQARYPDLSLVACNVYEIDRHVRRRFDLVVMGNLIEHLDNPGLALDALRPLVGGELLITCPNSFGLPNYLRFLTGRFREGGDHVVSFNRFTLEHLLARHGYSVVEAMTCLDRSPSAWWMQLLYWVPARVMRLFPKVGGTLLVVARVSGRDEPRRGTAQPHLSV